MSFVFAQHHQIQETVLACPFLKKVIFHKRECLSDALSLSYGVLKDRMAAVDLQLILTLAFTVDSVEVESRLSRDVFHPSMSGCLNRPNNASRTNKTLDEVLLRTARVTGQVKSLALSSKMGGVFCHVVLLRVDYDDDESLLSLLLLLFLKMKIIFIIGVTGRNSGFCLWCCWWKWWFLLLRSPLQMVASVVRDCYRW